MINLNSLLTVLMTVTMSNGDEIRPGVLRAPDARFENLPGYDFEPNYLEIEGYRIHYLDEGHANGEVILMLHGQPTWSYLYCKMVPILNAAGYRAIVPDLIGFGRSEKPVSMETRSFAFHVATHTQLVKALGLENVTFVGRG